MMSGDARDRWTEMVVVGRIARPHGLRGALVVDPATDFPERRFGPGATVYISGPEGPEPLIVAGARMQRGRPVVTLAGIDSIERASTLAGREVRIPQAEQHDLPDGSYYTHALVGCEVRTADHRRLGRVTEVQQAGGLSRLVVRAAGTDEELDIPLVDAICVEVDVVAKQIVVDPPDGLLELNRRG